LGGKKDRGEDGYKGESGGKDGEGWRRKNEGREVEGGNKKRKRKSSITDEP